MKIKVINPNSSDRVSQQVLDAARAVARPETQIVGGGVNGAPAAIESHRDMVLAGPGLLRAIEEGEAEGCDGYVAACFGNPGLNAARESTRQPMVGMAEAAFHAASYVASSFVIVTTLPRMRVFCESLLQDAGVQDRCKGIETINLSLSDLASGNQDISKPVLGAFERSLERNGADAIVLGSAGMAGLDGQLRTLLGVPVIDGVAAAVKWVEGLVDLGLTTSSAGPLAPPA